MSVSRFVSGLRAIELAAGATMVRVHALDRGPVFFGPPMGKRPQNRFDAPFLEYGVLYAAEHLEGAFVETVSRRPKGRILRREYVEQRGYSILKPQRPLKLAKIYDDGLQFHQVEAGEISVDDYGPSRALALALFQEFPDLDGLAYRSRYNNGQICYAIFDRLKIQEIETGPVERFKDDPERVDALMKLHGATFDPGPPLSGI